jgi:hypothetical protein
VYAVYISELIRRHNVAALKNTQGKPMMGDIDREIGGIMRAMDQVDALHPEGTLDPNDRREMVLRLTRICRYCGELRVDHATDKCLFAETHFEEEERWR